MNWQLVVSTVIALLGSTGLLKIIDAVSRRKTVKVEVADKVNEMTLEYAEAARTEARAARAEAAQARTEAQEARRQMAALSAEIETCTARLRLWRLEILDPAATLTGLRLMVQGEGGSNGSH